VETKHVRDQTCMPNSGLDVRIGGAASAKGSARIAALALALLADSRQWVAAQSPEFHALPTEAMAYTCASISPWRKPAELVPCVRMYLWLYAFDDYLEQTVTDLAHLDDTMQRCANIVSGNGPDDSHWLFSTLSSRQLDLASRPLYPALAGLWVEKFTTMLQGMRYEWTAPRSARRNESTVDEYLANAANIASEVTHLPRWITYGDSAVLDHLDDLVLALGDETVAIRLANDLASFPRERDQPGHDNILMYGVSPEWVKSEIGRRVDAVNGRLAHLVAADCLPAVELIRELDFVVTFYLIADFRGWGSDAR